MISVILVEDESRARAFISKGLKRAGLAVEDFPNLEDAEFLLSEKKPQVLILDRLLDGKDSLFDIPRLRKVSPQTKILILTALNDVDECVKGLELGGDDYLGKPFHFSELLARVRSLARRKTESTSSQNIASVQLKDLEINFSKQSVRKNGKVVDLTSLEFRLLSLFAGAPRKIFSREEILERVWGMDFDPSSNVVDRLVARLRKKLNLKKSDTHLKTLRGLGYRFLND